LLSSFFDPDTSHKIKIYQRIKAKEQQQQQQQQHHYSEKLEWQNPQ